ncbi:hypothetical protein [Clostridium diolis]|uniref:hypothetical protein n=1 Tax=Clostridium diolis TaxID=223919 RepID=UPI003AF9A831
MGKQIEMMSKEEWMASKGKIKKSKKLHGGIIYYLKITAIIFVLFLAFLVWRKEDIETTQRKAQEEQQVQAKIKRDNIQTNAITYSKMTVQDLLKSPSTAKFPSSAFQGEEYKEFLLKDEPDNQTWYIQSYVDSQNSFGAIVRSKWAVKIQVYEDERYKILDVDIK